MAAISFFTIMEITFVILMWLTVLVFSYLAYSDRETVVWPLIAMIGWFYLALQMNVITYVGWDQYGNYQSHNVQAGDPKTEGVFGMIDFMRMLGIVFFLVNVWWTYDRYSKQYDELTRRMSENGKDPANPYGF